MWGPVAHLNAVLSTPEMREAYNTCLPLITEFDTEVGQSEALYALFSQLERDVDPTEKTKLKLLSHTLRESALSLKKRNQGTIFLPYYTAAGDFLIHTH